MLGPFLENQGPCSLRSRPAAALRFVLEQSRLGKLLLERLERLFRVELVRIHLEGGCLGAEIGLYVRYTRQRLEGVTRPLRSAKASRHRHVKGDRFRQRCGLCRCCPLGRLFRGLVAGRARLGASGGEEHQQDWHVSSHLLVTSQFVKDTSAGPLGHSP
jgi:hypothetical protein